jgi:HEAT repeat protein
MGLKWRRLLAVGLPVLTALSLVSVAGLVSYQSWKLQADWSDYRNGDESYFLCHEEDQAVELVQEKLASKNPVDRQAAATALVRMAGIYSDDGFGRESLLDRLEVLANDTPDVRRVAELSLLDYYRTSNPAAGVLVKFPVDDLRMFFRESDSIRIRIAAAECMSLSSGASLKDAGEMIRHENGAIRIAGVKLIRRQASVAAASLFTQVVKSGDFDMRLKALEYDSRFASLIESQEPAIYEIVRSAVNLAVSDPEPRVSSEALKVLERRGGPPDRFNVVAILRSGRRTVLANALSALGSIGVRDDIALVRPFLKDHSEFVRSAALRCLSELRDSACVKNIEAALSDQSPIVRRTAAKLTDENGGPNTFEALLLAYVKDDSTSVRNAIQGVMWRYGDKTSIERLRSVQANAGPSARVGLGVVVRDLANVEKPVGPHRHDRRSRKPWGQLSLNRRSVEDE